MLIVQSGVIMIMAFPCMHIMYFNQIHPFRYIVSLEKENHLRLGAVVHTIPSYMGDNNGKIVV
jgi:hypothetical protein